MLNLIKSVIQNYGQKPLEIRYFQANPEEGITKLGLGSHLISGTLEESTIAKAGRVPSQVVHYNTLLL